MCKDYIYLKTNTLVMNMRSIHHQMLHPPLLLMNQRMILPSSWTSSWTSLSDPWTLSQHLSFSSSCYVQEKTQMVKDLEYLSVRLKSIKMRYTFFLEDLALDGLLYSLWVFKESSASTVSTNLQRVFTSNLDLLSPKKLNSKDNILPSYASPMHL